MKLLFVVRHAKSSWAEPDLADHDRPLNKRGRHDAPRMGKRLADHATPPQLIVSSSAVRALTTAQIIAKKLGRQLDDVVIDETIYGADPRDLINFIRRFDDRHQRVMLVGHNPTLTDLVNQLAAVDIENIPTCGIAVLSFDTDAWSAVGKRTAQLLDFDYPKKTEE